MILLALKEEIRTLIDKQKALMAKLKNDETIWKYDDSQTNTLNQAELETQIAALSNDSAKVQALETTIAVIGTMKAGKSTTINALIGEEILPHRLTAMTTLPTLIRHKPGQEKPVLKLNKPDLFKKLIDEVRAKVSLLDEHETDQSKINEALITVKDRSIDIHQEYVGKNEIHQALSLINDTLRLASHDSFSVELDTYLQHFTELTSLPTVEVEFRCLADHPQITNSGSLALLDTPGPNEAGQSDVLKRILTEQIEKNTSMILLVMNYTQLNTEQDSEIRNQIRNIKEVFKDRSFVVVNRFDEKKQNDLDETQTKKLASDLLNDSIDDDNFISPEAVFPVSSHYAFIVEKISKQMEAGIELGTLLSDKQNRDFIDAAFGMIEEDEIEELTFHDIKQKCTRLLKRSGYELFTKNMLEKAYTKAGANSLMAALARLDSNSSKIDRFTTVVGQGLKQELASLTESIERTRNLSNAIEISYQKLDEIKKNGISEYKEKARIELSNHVREIKSYIHNELTQEKEKLARKLENELKEKLNEKNKKIHLSRSRKKEINEIEKDLKNLRVEIERNSQNERGIIDFGLDKLAALRFSQQIGNTITALFSVMVGSLQDNLSILENNIQHSIQTELVERLEALCQNYEATMQEKGFDFNIPLTNNFALDVLDNIEISIDADDVVKIHKEKTLKSWIQRTRREGWIHNILQTISLGYREDYSEELKSDIVEEVRFKITLNDYIKKSQDLADEFYTKINDLLAKHFEDKLIPMIDNIFSEAIERVNGIEGALEKSKKIKDKDIAITSLISDTMDRIKTENSTQHKRLQITLQGTTSLMTEQ